MENKNGELPVITVGGFEVFLDESQKNVLREAIEKCGRDSWEVKNIMMLIVDANQKQNYFDPKNKNGFSSLGLTGDGSVAASYFARFQDTNGNVVTGSKKLIIYIAVDCEDGEPVISSLTEQGILDALNNWNGVDKGQSTIFKNKKYEYEGEYFHTLDREITYQRIMNGTKYYDTYKVWCISIS